CYPTDHHRHTAPHQPSPIRISPQTYSHPFLLVFPPYPPFTPTVFTPGGFGPPRGLTRASTCPWIDHSASGLQHATGSALFRLAFATATPHGLTSPHTVTRRLILQKARGHFTPPRGRNAPTACRHTVSGTIS